MSPELILFIIIILAAIILCLWRANQRSYPYSSALTKYLLDSVLNNRDNVYSVTSSVHYKTVVLKDNTEITYWHSNYPYAYADKGRVTKNGKVVMSWSGEMPSRRVVKKLFELPLKF